MNDLNEKISQLQQLQQSLILKKFDEDDAWEMGVFMQQKAKENNYVCGMSIDLNHKKVFHCTLKGTAPLSDLWLKRKTNTVYEFGKSSFEVKYMMERFEQTLTSRYGLPHEDYAAMGGAFPIAVEGVGVVGVVAVTGLPEETDHGLGVQGIQFLKEKQG